MSSDLPTTTDDDLPAPSNPGPQPRVAVDVLQRDQRAILFDGDADRTPPIQPLADGFDGLQAAVNWWQAAAVRTFGHLSDHMAASALVADDALRRALTGADATASERRHRHLQRVLTACDRAYRQLETQANEWLADGSDGDTDYRHVDVDRQRHVAMRPAFSRLDAAQAEALAALWGGFPDRAAVLEWSHRLPAVAAGEAGLARRLGTDRHAMRMLTTTTSEAARWRRHFAATTLLPAFAQRARRLRGKEQPRSKPDENPWNEV